MSYITSAWTAFETMAGDLWEAAINYRPQGLADLSGKKRHRKSGAEKFGVDDPQKIEKLVRLNDIRSHEWDTRNKMGSILQR